MLKRNNGQAHYAWAIIWVATDPFPSTHRYCIALATHLLPTGHSLSQQSRHNVGTAEPGIECFVAMWDSCSYALATVLRVAPIIMVCGLVNNASLLAGGVVEVCMM
jgi:hypothetical protein